MSCISWQNAPQRKRGRGEKHHTDKGRSLSPATTLDRATDLHNHVEVIAALKWRLNQRHTANGAHVIPVGRAARFFHDHGRIAVPTPTKISSSPSFREPYPSDHTDR